MIVSFRSLDKGVVFEGEVASLNIKTTSGEVTILDHHRPLMTKLVLCSARIGMYDGSSEQFDIQGGFLEINRSNQALLLLDVQERVTG